MGQKPKRATQRELQQDANAAPRLMAAERVRIVAQWGQAKTEYPRELGIAALFEEQVKLYGPSTAVACADDRLSYEELNRRANQLAHYLRGLGLRPEEVVGVCLERSSWMLVGLLGILKAGGAYLPLDPSYPRERLEFMLKDGGARLLLAHECLAGTLPRHEGLTVVTLDTDWKKIARQSESDPALRAHGGNLAYVMYTSGSTGRPKAVMVEQRGITRLVKNTNYMQIVPGDVFSQLSPISFDASVLEIFGALLNGASLAIIERETSLDAWKLGHAFRDKKVNVAFLTTALFNQIAKEAPGSFENLRYVMFGGEAADPRSAREVLAAAKPRQLLNLYGPTETTVLVTWFHVDKVEQEVASLPIGAPVANTEVYILDESAQPVPVQVAGEIYAGGDGLARGYLNRPDLTAASFVPDAVSGKPGARLYRTGDRGKWRADGNIEFAGRVDNQVKVRGFRIELGEIEAVLNLHPAVFQVVVTAHKNPAGALRLVAFAVLHRDHVAGEPDLRGYLDARLPQHMIPSQFVFIDQLPLTAEGKIDRSALKPSEVDKPVYAQTRIEKALADACSTVLALPHVPLNATFLELGGSSLNATQVSAAVCDAISVKFPLQELLGGKPLLEIAWELEKYPNQPSTRPADFRNRRKGTSTLPASYSQERVWFIHSMAPSNLAYHFIARLTFTGELDRDALSQSLTRILERHEIYRTTLAEVDGVLVQQIHEPWQVRLDVAAAEDAAHAETIFQQECRQPFDLSRLPLARWKLVRLAPQKHVLLIVEQHVVHDGWSFNVFLRELTELYRSFAEGGVPQIDPEPLQFADFARWQRDWMESREAQEQIEYWKKALTGVSPLLQLPYDHSRPAVQTYSGAAPRLQIEASLEQELLSAAGECKVTLFMLFAAAFQVLLSKYSGQESFCIATGIANRRWSETRNLIGMLVNNLLLPTRISGGQSLGEVIENVRKTTLEAYAHQDVPFDKIVHAIHPARDASYNPISQVMLSFHDSPMECVRLANVDLDIEIGISNGAAKFDLNIIVIAPQNQTLSPRKKTGYSILWEYNADLFDAETMSRMMDHYLHLLRQTACNRNRKVADVGLLSQKERQQILREWNDTGSGYPSGKCVHELFEEQAQRTPTAVAVSCEGQDLSYLELNRRANQLAHYLRDLGMQPDALVAICMERGMEMIVAVLAVLKAGGAYVPLDPAYPTERLRFMMQDSKPTALLTQAHLRQLFEGIDSSLPVLDLAADAPAWNRQLESNPDHNSIGLTSGNLAYVIYTSGSTGRPKGVLVEHRNVTRLFSATAAWFHFNAQDVWSFFHSYSFDFSVWEIWGALLYGGRLVVVPREVARSPQDFYRLVCREAITVLNQTPSAFRQLIAAQAASGETHCLRHVIFGGEALETASLMPWYEQNEGAGTRLINMYGITETTVHVTYRPLTSADAEEKGRNSPIGRRIPDLRTYVLDAHGEPVPVGVSGELYVGGGGVARGYLHRPALTAERFVPDPFSDEPGARLYRTGDRVRFRPDSNLEFLGRNDDQVKIRGFRIELGEVETALQAHPQVSAAVVLLREDQPGDKRLVAYVTLKAGSDALRGDHLREHLEHSLPAYMVPARLVVLPELPLNANGKINRQALPAPDWRREEEDGPRQGPRNRIEEALVEIWAEVLDIDPQQISITDNFFSLGGHSLQASQVSTRIQAMRNYKLPLRWLFETPTIAELAQRLAEAIASGPEFPLPAIEPLRDGRPVPCSYAQEGLWFLHQLEPENAVYNVSVNILLRGDLDVAVLTRALRQVVERHEVLRTSLQMRDGQLVQEVSGPALPAVPLLDLNGFTADTRRAALEGLMLEEAQRQFDLSRDHLLRAQLVRVEERTHALLLTFHHSVFDGWSASVLAREISAIYTALQRGQEASLPPLRYQYRDFALMEREVLRGALMDKMRQYWSSRLENAPQVLDLPTDYPRPKKHRFAGSIYRAVLPAGVREALQSMSAREGSTLFPALLAAYRVLLARYSGQKDILIGVPVANRWSRHFEDLIGFFANTLPFRTELAGNLSFRKLVKAETETMLEAMAHCYLPFGRLVEMLQLERNIGFNPGVQVMFVMQNGVDLTLQIPGIVSERLPVNTNSAKLDITLAMENRDDGLAMLWEYSSELFHPDTIARMARHFGVLLEDALARPDAPVDTLEILTQAERRQLTEWNHTQEAYRIRHQAEIQAEDDSKPDPAKTGGSFPIGRPIANTQTYILDADLNPRPAGLPGELYLGGLGLARGYLGRPALTAERFLPNPFSADGARLYRTGDRACYRPDGALEFLGRIDSQIKMGGFRIEPGEIEAVLLKHGSVSTAVVLPWQGPAGTRHLVAYVVAQAGLRLPQEALREHVSSELPAYMRPHIFVLLDSMPLTPNGKVDRKALPAPDSVAPSATGSSISPNNALEVRIRQIWQTLLPVKEPGMEDNFFDLGGYSLLAFQVFDHLKGSFPALTMTDIFTYPTIRSLARHLDQGDKETAATDQGQSRGRLRKRLKEARPRTLAAAAAVHSAVPQDK